MSFELKYRSKDFKEVIGNEDTKFILNKFISSKETPHSYLFYGAKGCSKTTFARIMSNELDCEIIEINNSNNRGIDTIRDIIYQGSETGNLLSDKKNKAFILDECHQLPKLSQDALLKILEEPPEHIYFFLCTTEPQKLLGAVKSRCKQFKVEEISVRQLYPYLIEISIKENNEISKKVARLIAETSEGHVRDALSILEKVITFEDEEKQIKIANEKIEDAKEIIDLCKMLLKNETYNDEIKNTLQSLSKQKTNPESIRKVILSYMQKVALGKYNIQKAVIIIDNMREIYYDFAVLVCDIYRIFNA